MTTDQVTGAVGRVAAAPAAIAAAHFGGRLAFETDVSDVYADLTAHAPGLVVVDSRAREAWDAGHLPGAVHLPTADVPTRAADVVPAGSLVVTYCWGPGCNGSTRAALAFAELGYAVKEMIGGFEYWVREGLPFVVGDATTYPPVDPLTAPACGC